MVERALRPAWAEIDLAAVRRNVRLLCAISSPARLCAVVKADGYGHGAVAVARAVLEGGAAELAVALVDEGVELREAGIEAPILVLSEPSADAMDEAIRWRLTPTLYTLEGISLCAAAVQAAGGAEPAGVDVKVDTGMHRVGVDAGALVALVRVLETRPELAFAGLWTHLAVADEPDNPFTLEQLRRYLAARAALADAGLPTGGRAHAANSAGAIAWPGTRLDLVRCGIAIYGYAPSRALEPILAAEAKRVGGEAAGSLPAGLEPALTWKARASFVRELEAGERLSYGLRAALPSRSLVATVPLGYADGIPRAYFEAGGEVLVGGRRRRLAGTVTMDQIMIDCGDDGFVRPGDEVVLIGSQGGGCITAFDWGDRLGTIGYEIVARIGSRVKRIYRDAADGGEDSAI